MNKFFGVFKLMTKMTPVPNSPIPGIDGVKTIELIPIDSKAFSKESDAIKLIDSFPEDVGGFVILNIYMKPKKPQMIIKK